MVAGASLLGGIVQLVTGFGSSIIIMIFLPVFLSMTAAPDVSDVITMTLSFSILWRYRTYVKLKNILFFNAVDKQPVGENVTFPMACPITR